MLGGDPNAVVADAKQAVGVRRFGADSNNRWPLAAKLDGVDDQILENLGQQRPVSLDGGKFGYINHRAAFLNGPVQVVKSVLERKIGVYFLSGFSGPPHTRELQ